MKFQWQPLLALCLLSCFAFAGQDNPAHGDVMDADSLRKVHTYCLDTSLLSITQLKEFRAFAAHAQKPKGVFSKLNWQLMDYCGDADATVLVSMEETERRRFHVANSSEIPQMLQRAKLLITSDVLDKTLYQGDGGEYVDDRQDAFGSAFSELLKHMKSLLK